MLLAMLAFCNRRSRPIFFIFMQARKNSLVSVRLHGLTGLMLAAFVAACGGGGGGGGSNVGAPSTPVLGTSGPWPTSGNYSVVLKATGSTATGGLQTALSFVHAADKSATYILDTTSAKSTFGSSLELGTFSAAFKTVGAISPVAFVDAPNGAVRVTSQVANGSRPLQSQAASVALCDSTVVLANNYAVPFASEMLVGGPGPDAACGNADDTQRLVRFTPSGVPTVGAEQAGSKVVGYFRSLTDGTPTHWVHANNNGEVATTPLGGALKVSLRAAGVAIATSKALGNFSDIVLFVQDGLLFSATSAAVVQPVKQLSALSGPEGWKLAGSDVTNIYVYVNSGLAASGTGTWTLLSIARANQAATVISTGTGSIFAAEAASNAVFLSQLQGTAFTIQRYSTVLATTSVFYGPSTTAASTVVKLANDVGLQMTVPTSGSGIKTDVVDLSNGTILRPGDATIILGYDRPSFDTMTNVNVPIGIFLAAPYGSLGYSGATLTRFDVSGRTQSTIGTVATNQQLGGSIFDPVFLTPINVSNFFGGIEARRIPGGVFTGASKVYTLDFFTPVPQMRETTTVIF